jgi:hypothetical protein
MGTKNLIAITEAKGIDKLNTKGFQLELNELPGNAK